MLGRSVSNRGRLAKVKSILPGLQKERKNLEFTIPTFDWLYSISLELLPCGMRVLYLGYREIRHQSQPIIS